MAAVALDQQRAHRARGHRRRQRLVVSDQTLEHGLTQARGGRDRRAHNRPKLPRVSREADAPHVAVDEKHRQQRFEQRRLTSLVNEAVRDGERADEFAGAVAQQEARRNARAHDDLVPQDLLQRGQPEGAS